MATYNIREALDVVLGATQDPTLLLNFTIEQLAKVAKDLYGPDATLEENQWGDVLVNYTDAEGREEQDKLAELAPDMSRWYARGLSVIEVTPSDAGAVWSSVRGWHVRYVDALMSDELDRMDGDWRSTLDDNGYVPEGWYEAGNVDWPAPEDYTIEQYLDFIGWEKVIP